jgi:hypothetical protein
MNFHSAAKAEREGVIEAKFGGLFLDPTIPSDGEFVVYYPSHNFAGFATSR